VFFVSLTPAVILILSLKPQDHEQVFHLLLVDIMHGNRAQNVRTSDCDKKANVSSVCGTGWTITL
jgi:hypothetical protein